MPADRRPADTLPRDARSAAQQRHHSVRGHRELHAAVRAIDRQRFGENVKRTVRALRSNCSGNANCAASNHPSIWTENAARAPRFLIDVLEHSAEKCVLLFVCFWGTGGSAGKSMFAN